MKIILQIMHVEKLKDVEYEEEGEDAFYSGFRTDNESITESKMSTF